MKIQKVFLILSLVFISDSFTSSKKKPWKSTRRITFSASLGNVIDQSKINHTPSNTKTKTSTPKTIAEPIIDCLNINLINDSIIDPISASESQPADLMSFDATKTNPYQDESSKQPEPEKVELTSKTIEKTKYGDVIEQLKNSIISLQHKLILSPNDSVLKLQIFSNQFILMIIMYGQKKHEESGSK